MNRLIQSGLMFGNLVHVASPVLVERYNRALKHLTGRETTLTDFYIDISGFSPEIGHELDDPLYLNHAGVNRQFILLTTEQKRAPLLNAKFSTSRSILKHFIEENEAQLFALTARDAVAGELVNSVYRITTPQQLFDIRTIEVEADTTSGTVRQAHALSDKVDRFMSHEDAWFDDTLIAEMIELAAQTGDVSRNPVKLKEMSFQQGNFWTTHFGPLYVFQDVEHPAIITSGDKSALKFNDKRYVFDLRDRKQIAYFLDLNKLVEPVVAARGIDSAAILRQKMDFILIDAVASVAGDVQGRSRREMRRLARRHAELLPPEFHALGDLVNWAENGGRWPTISAEHPAYFYTLRAANHADRDLVNMLLAELTQKDIRQLFVCHKELFYAAYSGWPEMKKAYVVEYLKNEYQVDKIGMREALFGHDAPLGEDVDATDGLIDRVGPWGRVRR